jgi:hypothetical protein
MMRIRAAACVLLVLAAAAGCARKPVLNTYRLVARDRSRVLVPPGLVDPETPRRTVTADGVSARPCRPEDGPVHLERRRGKWRATIDRQALLQQRPGWLTAWGIRLETQGCLPVGEGERLAHAVAEAVPLDSSAAFRLLYAPFLSGYYVELDSAHRLEVRSPIFRAGSPDEEMTIAAVSGEGNRLAVDLKTPADSIGYEIDWYAMEAIAGRPGYRIVPLSADRTVAGVTERLPAPSTRHLNFPPQAAFFRLFYKTEANGILAVVVAGKTRNDLDQRTRLLSEDPNACLQQSGLCMVLPRRVAVNPYVVISVNSRPVMVAPGATVASAIIASGTRDTASVLPRLSVTRLFRNRPTPVEFDRNTRDILGMMLIGGETIAWTD